MQPTFSSSRILLPVRPWFIFLSLIAAAVLNFLPTAHWRGGAGALLLERP